MKYTIIQITIENNKEKVRYLDYTELTYEEARKIVEELNPTNLNARFKEIPMARYLGNA